VTAFNDLITTVPGNLAVENVNIFFTHYEIFFQQLVHCLINFEGNNFTTGDLHFLLLVIVLVLHLVKNNILFFCTNNEIDPNVYKIFLEHFLKKEEIDGGTKELIQAIISILKSI
jgi:hypothetical protein